MFPRIATILHYCSNDYRFIHRSVQECSRFSSQIIIPFANRFFNGEEENQFLLEKSMEENPSCDFIRFAYDEKLLYSPFLHRSPEDEDWLCCWHSTSRYVGSFFVRPDIEWLFFLDADEIVEGERFLEWLKKGFNPEEKAIWFYSYMYGLRATQQKEEWQLTGLLLNKNCVNSHQLLNPQERCGIFQDLTEKKRLGGLGLDGKPMIHHYSWVRSEEEQRKKAITWAKKNQKDWMAWLTDEPETIHPYFDPLSISIPTGIAQEKLFLNERFVTRRQILEIELITSK